MNRFQPIDDNRAERNLLICSSRAKPFVRRSEGFSANRANRVPGSLPLSLIRIDYHHRLALMKATPWITYRTRFLIKARQLTTSLTFTDSLGRRHSGRKGDYLVESSEGILSIASRQILRRYLCPLACGRITQSCHSLLHGRVVAIQKFASDLNPCRERMSLKRRECVRKSGPAHDPVHNRTHNQDRHERMHNQPTYERHNLNPTPDGRLTHVRNQEPNLNPCLMHRHNHHDPINNRRRAALQRNVLSPFVQPGFSPCADGSFRSNWNKIPRFQASSKARIFLVPICECAMNSPCGKIIPSPRITPVIVGDTTCCVSLLTGTISGSNFAFP